jgi:copper homeostasis protein
MTPVLEVIATSLDDALAAEDGGAARIELVTALDRDGLSPPLELVAAVVSRLRIPVRVMIRDQEPFEVTDPAIVDRMCAAAAHVSRLPVDGLVAGGIDARRRVDEGLLARVAAAAPHLPVTFHRAFETVEDETAACEALRRTPAVDRLLVRGAGERWQDRFAHLEALAERLGPRIRVLAAAGQDRALMAAVAGNAALGEVHVGRAARDPELVHAPVSADKVRALVRVLHGG